MRNKFFTAIILLIFAALIFTAHICGFGQKQSEKDQTYKQLDLFADVFAYVKEDYVKEMTSKELIYGALKGMLSNLDAHSLFLDPDAYNELKIDTEGKFGGLGIEITIREGLITIITPIEDTPAWKAGLKSGDRIVKIGDEVTRGYSLMDAVKKMRGKPGTKITITILREKENKLMDFTIVRDIIKIKDIKEAKILEDGIAYIRLSEFRENTAKELQNKLKKLTSEGMLALIIDLRNNPGGLLSAAVDVAEQFIEKNKIVVSTQGRDEEKKIEFKSGFNNPLIDIPAVVMINEGSASGSEILAGCLQDYKRAIILGTKSFGKGSVQTLIPLADGSAIKLTTSIYFTPAGRMIHEKGIMPDILVEKMEIKKNEEVKDDPNLAGEIFDKLEDENAEHKKEEGYRQDNQILAAIDVLKAVLIYKNNEK